MKKYIVVALAVTGHGKKIHRSTDEVTEGDFPEGVAVKLVESGHLKEAKSTKKAEKEAAEEATEEEATEEEATEEEATEKEASKGKKPNSKSK